MKDRVFVSRDGHWLVSGAVISLGRWLHSFVLVDLTSRAGRAGRARRGWHDDRSRVPSRKSSHVSICHLP